MGKTDPIKETKDTGLSNDATLSETKATKAKTTAKKAPAKKSPAKKSTAATKKTATATKKATASATKKASAATEKTADAAEEAVAQTKTPTKRKTATKTTKGKAKKKKYKLVIVESPAKAKTIAKFLGSGYRVVASNGHIRDLPKSQLGVDVENNFEPKYITLRGRGEVLKKIRKEAKGADTIYLATDPDREGEAISWHLAHILDIDEKEPSRIVFNEITPTAVKAAIKTPRTIDMDLVNAQQARRVLDRLVGYKISPILWAKVRKGLSAGRVQSVATRLIVDREEEINAFEPKEFWSIQADLLSAQGKKPFTAQYYGKDGKKVIPSTETEAMTLVKAVQKNKFTAMEVKRGERKQNPAPPFTTSNLQQEASRKLGFTTKRTMIIAQQLYEGVDVGGKGSVGLVTYIRTDSVRVSNDALDVVRDTIGKRFGAEYLPEKPNFYKGRKNAQDAHEAIRPSYIDEYPPEVLKGKLSNDQFKLYKLIYERFVSSQMMPARYETMSVRIDAGGREEFRSSGRRVIFDGYTKIYQEGKDAKSDEDEESGMLPEIDEGDVFPLQELTPEQHFTQPPPRFTEASLVKTMEEKGIGRPSTYAPTISTIVDRGYARREKRVLFPTELGELVTGIMKDNFANIVDEEFTAQMEETLDGIEAEESEWKDVVSDFYGPFEKSLEAAEANIEKIEVEDEVSDIPCEKCGAMMVYKYGRFGRFLACSNYPECKNTKAIRTAIDTPCPKCGAKILKRKSRKGGRIFYGCERYPDCDFVSWDYPAEEKCPECGSMMVYKRTKNGDWELRCTNAECKHVMPAQKEPGEFSYAQ